MAKSCSSVAQIEWCEFSRDKTTVETLQQSITHRFWLLPSVDGETHDLWRVATYKFGTTNPEYLPHRHTNAPEVIGKVHNEAVWMLQSLIASVVHTYYMLCNPLGELTKQRATNAEPGSKLWWQGFLLDRYKRVLDVAEDVREATILRPWQSKHLNAYLISLVGWRETLKMETVDKHTPLSLLPTPVLELDWAKWWLSTHAPDNLADYDWDRWRRKTDRKFPFLLYTSQDLSPGPNGFKFIKSDNGNGTEATVSNGDLEEQGADIQMHGSVQRVEMDIAPDRTEQEHTAEKHTANRVSDGTKSAEEMFATVRSVAEKEAAYKMAEAEKEAAARMLAEKEEAYKAAEAEKEAAERLVAEKEAAYRVVAAQREAAYKVAVEKEVAYRMAVAEKEMANLEATRKQAAQRNTQVASTEGSSHQKGQPKTNVPPRGNPGAQKKRKGLSKKQQRKLKRKKAIEAEKRAMAGMAQRDVPRKMQAGPARGDGQQGGRQVAGALPQKLEPTEITIPDAGRKRKASEDMGHRSNPKKSKPDKVDGMRSSVGETLVA